MKQDRKKRVPEGRIVSFYSYKGGTGRSMAVANIAWILALSGKKVLVVDWDLEAPGIHRYFHPFLEDKELVKTEGLIDFVEKLAGRAAVASSPLSADQVDVIEYVTMLNWPANFSLSWERFGESAGIDLLVAGRQGPAYGSKLNSFNWIDFYEKLGGRRLLEIVRKQLREIYDYVLIDSRTGVSDTSGICTVEMPDTLVTCFTLNDQSIIGASGVMTSVLALRQSRLEAMPSNGIPLDVKASLVPQAFRIFPVPTRVEIGGEQSKRQLALEFAQEKFAPFINHLPKALHSRYWGRVQLAYFPFYAFEEIPAVFGDPANEDLSISTALKQITRFITGDESLEIVPLAPDDELGAEELRKEVLGWYLRKERVGKQARVGYWNVPQLRNEAFTGREQILTDLRDDLLKKGKQALFGLGGVGKTQIAVEYAYRHRDEYTAVLWCFAGTEQSVRGGYAAIAALLDLPEKDSQEQAKITEAVKGWLEQNTGWLLVLDNADDPAMLKPFLPQQGKGHVLLTSRAYSFQKIGLVSPREVNVLSPDEAREFLLRRTGKGPTEKSEADALAKEVGYLPLALEQAAAYIIESGASFSSYLAGYRKQGLKLLEKQGPVLGNDEREQQNRTVATVWALNLADIEKDFPASADLLRLSAFLAPDAIPLELLENGGDELPEKLSAKLAEAAEDSLVLDELLKPLLRFSLIRRDEEKRTYSIHPLVQEVVRDGLSKEDQKAWAERAVRVVNLAFPNPEYFENWPACDRFLSHALACANFINSLNLEFAEAARMLNQAGYYLNERAEYAQAEPLYRRSFAIREKALGPEHPDTAQSLNNLALLLKTQGKYDEAEPLYRRSLAIREKALGPEHPDTALSLNNLSLLYRDQGRYQKAEPLQQRALAIREKALGPDHPSTATSLNNLALLLHAQGKLAEADPLLRRALAIDEKALGPEHPNTAASLNNLAFLLEGQGKYEEAEPLYWRALEIREKALGPEHPDTAGSLNALAVLLDNQGKPAEAEPLYRRALSIYEKTLGQEHPTTVGVRNNLILFYREQGRNAEADALEQGAKGKAK